MKRVAVILPVYCKDRPDYIRLSVDSILQQTYKEIKVFIGVDGPVGDDIRDRLEKYGSDGRVQVLWFEENRGLACVLNDLLRQSFKDGFEYIARMDADDISMPDRLEIQMGFLEAHPEIDVVGGAIEEIDEKGDSRNKTIIYPETPEACRAFFAKRNPHAHPAVLFRKSFFNKMGGGKFYRPEYRQNQDTMLWYDGLMHGTCHANLQGTILKFRITDTLFRKRRNGWAFARKQLNDRIKINRDLGYGWPADLFGVAMFVLIVSPPFIKKIAYRVFR